MKMTSVIGSAGGKCKKGKMTQVKSQAYHVMLFFLFLYG